MWAGYWLFVRSQTNTSINRWLTSNQIEQGNESHLGYFASRPFLFTFSIRVRNRDSVNFYAARRIVETNGLASLKNLYCRPDLIVCTVFFDESRMFDSLRLAKSKPEWADSVRLRQAAAS